MSRDEGTLFSNMEMSERKEMKTSHGQGTLIHAPWFKDVPKHLKGQAVQS